MAEKKKHIKLLSPIGEAKWVHLHKPKPPYVDPKTGKSRGGPSYQISIIFEKDDPAWGPWAKKVIDQVRALPIKKRDDGQTEPKYFPIKNEYDKEKKATGKLIVNFKTGEKFKPGIFDSFNQPIPDTVLIGNGSKVIVSYSENLYEELGGGMTFYLNAVQVIELVEYKPQSAESYGFESVITGGGTDEPSDAPTLNPDEKQDDLPF